LGRDFKRLAYAECMPNPSGHPENLTLTCANKPGHALERGLAAVRSPSTGASQEIERPSSEMYARTNVGLSSHGATVNA
jgi:hypothetical protein